MKEKRIGDKILLGVGITFAVAIGLILLLPFLMLGLLFLSIAQSNNYAAAPDQLMFINRSSAAVHSVSLDDTVITDGMLELGDGITVDWETWPTTLTVNGENGILAQLEICKEPYKDWSKHCWYVTAQDGPEGLFLTLSHVEKLEKAGKVMGERVNLDISDGMVALFDAPGRGINGDGHDFMILQFGEKEGVELEAQLSTAIGWHSYEESELLEDVFFEEHSFCRSYIYDVPRPAKGWFFFRDTYNSQHGANDEGQWSLRRVGLPNNYTAAIYDSVSRTLYIYDFDS